MDMAVKAFLGALAKRHGPVFDVRTRLIHPILLAPLNKLDELVPNKRDLCFRILGSCAVSNPLVVLAAVIEPYDDGNGQRTALIAAKEMRNCLAG
jgi:hypothetical protein